MSERISVDAKEFKAFLAENQQLVERYGKLLDRLESLKKLNGELEERLRLAQEKISIFEHKIVTDVREADETLRKARDTMSRLMEQADHVLSGE
jgi:predicted  nucleic acid-binding Zn-ribbon protein